MKGRHIIDMNKLDNIKKFIGSHINLPEKIERSEKEQLLVNEEAKNLSLYEIYICPFCMRVRHAIKKLNVPIEYRNIQKNSDHRSTLLSDGGSLQTPCLRIDEENDTRYMYESRDIINYLEKRFA